MSKKDQFQLSKLVEHLSHELRTPLSAILGYSELLEKSNNLDEAEKNHLEKIAASGTQLLDVVNDIIEISNIESGNTQPEEVVIQRDELISKLKNKFSPIARLNETELSVSVSSNVQETFNGDYKKIQTILFSLINNALKFTEKGKVEIEVSVPENDGNFLHFTVKNTGVGMSDQEMKHIFKPFWQVNAKQKSGTGLGLTTCQKLVKVLGGTLEVTSKKGKGTQVFLKVPISMPLANEVRKGNNPPSRVKLNPSKSLKALIVDDLPINRTLARIMLEMKDFRTIEAKNGKEALGYYQDHKPDVILMDISMPVMDGVKSMEKIRMLNNHGKNLPIIAITAGGHGGTRSELIDKGFSEYIQKPFKEKELFEKISLFLPLANKDYRRAPQKNGSVKV